MSTITPTSSADDSDPITPLLEAFIRLQDSDAPPDIEAFCALQPERVRDVLRERCQQYVANEQLLFGLGSSVNVAPTGEQKLGELRILREIGRGGMGVVYLAEQPSLNRRVAVKVLPPHMSLDSRRVERFLAEARAAARLRHPGIVPILGVGEEDGARYFTMEYVEGRSLHEIFHARPYRRVRETGLGIRKGLGPAEEVAAILAEVADALHYAHENNVVHRDVKPQNILIGEDGRVRVVDFGLAKDETAASLSRTGDLAGTPFYMSPEQVAGRRGQIDRRSDVFSLGVMMYELLTGVRPFSGSTTVRVMDNIVYARARPLRSVNPSLRRDLETICAKAMEKGPARRYATASEFADDLRRFLAGQPILAAPPSLARRCAGCFAKRGAAATVSSLLLVAIGAGAGWVWHERQSTQRPSQSSTSTSSGRAERQTAGDARERSPARPDEANPGAPSNGVPAAAGRGAALAQARDALVDIQQKFESQQGNAVDQSISAAATAPVGTSAEARRLTMQSMGQLAVDPGLALLLGIEAAKIAPDVHANAALLLALDACTEREQIYRSSTEIVCATHSGLGQWLLIATASGQVRVLDASSHAIRYRLDFESQLTDAAINSTGSSVAVARADGGVEVWRIRPATERLIEIPNKKGARVDALRFRPNPDNARYAIEEPRRDAFVLESDFLTIASGSLLQTYGAPSGQLLGAYEAGPGPLSFDHAPQGTSVAVGCGDGVVRIYSSDMGGLKRELRAHSDSVSSVEFNRTGDLVVTASGDRSVRIFQVRSGAETIPPITSGNVFLSARFDPQGVRVITAEAANPFYGEGPAAAKVWNAATGQLIDALRANQGDVLLAEFEPGGRAAITAGEDGTVRLWQSAPVVLRLGMLQAPAAMCKSADPGRHAREILTATRTPRGAIAAVHSVVDPRDPIALGDDASVTCVAWDPDGVHAAVGNERGVIAIYDVESRDRIMAWEAHDAPIYQLRFSADGQRLVSVGYGTAVAIVWDLVEGDEVCLVAHGSVPLQSATISADGALLATSSGVDRATRIWDVETGELLRKIAWTALEMYTNWPVPVDGAAFAGDRLVLAEFVDHLREVPVDGAGPERTFGAQDSEILCVDVSPDRTLVATGAMDGTARIFDAESGEARLISRGFSTPVSSVRFSADGETLLVGSIWTSLYQSIPVSPLARALQRAPRALTPDERDRFQIGTAAERAVYRAGWDKATDESDQSDESDD